MEAKGEMNCRHKANKTPELINTNKERTTNRISSRYECYQHIINLLDQRLDLEKQVTQLKYELEIYSIRYEQLKMDNEKLKMKNKHLKSYIDNKNEFGKSSKELCLEIMTDEDTDSLNEEAVNKHKPIE